MSMNSNIQPFGSGIVRAAGSFERRRMGYSSTMERPSTTALAIWVTVQLAALGLSAMRVMFWAHEPQDSEQFALCLMLATQVGLAALIFPALLNNAVSLVGALVSGFAMAELASFLANAGSQSLIAAAVYVSLWLVSLSLVAQVLRSQRSKLLSSGVAVLIALGGVILVYLREEFGNGGSSMPQSARAIFGPIMGAISLTIPENTHAGIWTEMGILLVAAALIHLVFKKRSA